MTPSLENLHKGVKNTTGNMKVGQFYYCDLCHNPIYDKSSGFIIHGNIYEADPAKRSGLIGNSFPNVTPEDSIKVEDVLEKVYCLDCLCKTLKINSQHVRKDIRPADGFRKISHHPTPPVG